jgi:DNA-binding response OmpR family regulator
MAKVLIIDGDTDFQQATQLVLKKHDFEVVSAYDPEEGIRKVQDENPDLIILDVIMPSDLEGFDVARKIRENLRLRELPILLLTAVHTEKEVPYRFGPHEEWLPVDYFMDKPVDPDVLVAKVKELLNISG